jgi:hypothetical protein
VQGKARVGSKMGKVMRSRRNFPLTPDPDAPTFSAAAMGDSRNQGLAITMSTLYTGALCVAEALLLFGLVLRLLASLALLFLGKRRPPKFQTATESKLSSSSAPSDFPAAAAVGLRPAPARCSCLCFAPAAVFGQFSLLPGPALRPEPSLWALGFWGMGGCLSAELRAGCWLLGYWVLGLIAYPLLLAAPRASLLGYELRNPADRGPAGLRVGCWLCAVQQAASDEQLAWFLAKPWPWAIPAGAGRGDGPVRPARCALARVARSSPRPVHYWLTG